MIKAHEMKLPIAVATAVATLLAALTCVEVALDQSWSTGIFAAVPVFVVAFVVVAAISWLVTAGRRPSG